MALVDYVSVKPTIQTKRLCIRPMNEKDIDSLREWMPDPSIYTYWGKGPSKAEKNPELLFEVSGGTVLVSVRGDVPADTKVSNRTVPADTPADTLMCNNCLL